MCCWEIWRRRRTEWSAFLLTRSSTLRYFCEDACRHVPPARLPEVVVGALDLPSADQLDVAPGGIAFGRHLGGVGALLLAKAVGRMTVAADRGAGKKGAEIRNGVLKVSLLI